MGAMGKTSNYIIRLPVAGAFASGDGRLRADHFQLAQALGFLRGRRRAGSGDPGATRALRLLPVTGTPAVRCTAACSAVIPWSSAAASAAASTGSCGDRAKCCMTPAVVSGVLACGAKRDQRGQRRAVGRAVRRAAEASPDRASSGWSSSAWISSRTSEGARRCP